MVLQLYIQQPVGTTSSVCYCYRGLLYMALIPIIQPADETADHERGKKSQDGVAEREVAGKSAFHCGYHLLRFAAFSSAVNWYVYAGNPFRESEW